MGHGHHDLGSGVEWRKDQTLVLSTRDPEVVSRLYGSLDADASPIEQVHGKGGLTIARVDDSVVEEEVNFGVANAFGRILPIEDKVETEDDPFTRLSGKEFDVEPLVLGALELQIGSAKTSATFEMVVVFPVEGVRVEALRVGRDDVALLETLDQSGTMTANY